MDFEDTSKIDIDQTQRKNQGGSQVFGLRNERIALPSAKMDKTAVDFAT